MVFRSISILGAAAPLLVSATLAFASDRGDSTWVEPDPAADLWDFYIFPAMSFSPSSDGPATGSAVAIITAGAQPDLGIQYRINFDTDPSDDEVAGISEDAAFEIWWQSDPSNGKRCINVAFGDETFSNCGVSGTVLPDDSIQFTADWGQDEISVFSGWRGASAWGSGEGMQTAFGLLKAKAAECAITDCDYLEWATYDTAWSEVEIEDGSAGDEFSGDAQFAVVIEFPVSALPNEFSTWGASYRHAGFIRTPEGDLNRGPWVQMDRAAAPWVWLLLDSATTRNLYNRGPVDESSFRSAILGAVTAIRADAEGSLLIFNDGTVETPHAIPSVDEVVSYFHPDVLRVTLDGTFGSFPNGRNLGTDITDEFLSLLIGQPTVDDYERPLCLPEPGFPYLTDTVCEIE
ncbi:MAG: hypothetical protein KC561_07400 [Myxococcales bacterium]|nr:hypothetical protein [Myxococcales bacterium]